METADFASRDFNYPNCQFENFRHSQRSLDGRVPGFSGERETNR